jgi:hypothetical protein
MNPEEILVKDTFVKSHRTIIEPFKEERSQIKILDKTLK